MLYPGLYLESYSTLRIDCKGRQVDCVKLYSSRTMPPESEFRHRGNRAAPQNVFDWMLKQRVFHVPLAGRVSLKAHFALRQ